jgi:uncharacterized protein (DUF2164 family)
MNAQRTTTMSKISFNTDEKASLIEKLQRYVDRELGVELGQFDGDFLVDFISREMGPHFYNQGVRDAMAVFDSRLEAIDEDLYGILKDV